MVGDRSPRQRASAEAASPAPHAARHIRLARTPEEIAACFPVMHQLRPLLAAESFVARIQAQQAEGYHLASLAISHPAAPATPDRIVAVTGFRVREMLATGRTLYVDDLVTDYEARSAGYGKAMLDWLKHYATEAGCETLSLDSGTHRQDAHAFYLRERLRITSFHFAIPLIHP